MRITYKLSAASTDVHLTILATKISLKTFIVLKCQLIYILEI